ncbi:hypothetical protein HNR06_004417 [Nocardiopsis arvandica]|uniref:Uncharacterized protein n=1 Tax=Nocardiopsis sinuspersici TaxID=501010 RepID=A0A7Z0BKG6_9ACTN|nr:hypothetical protein [Nocardiopsis sinuspersici]NYH54828.1 hypothetical protein [Nocardiopsis sinuspersici]
MLPQPSIARVPGTGAHVIVDSGGTGVVRTSSGRFLRLVSPPPGLLDALAGASDGDGEASAYAEALRARMSALEEEDAQRRWPGPRREVALVGGGPLIDAVADALAGWGAAVTRHTDGGALLSTMDGAADGGRRGGGTAGPRGGGTRPWGLVVAYADSPVERVGWDRLDTLPSQGVAWLRAYREGENCFVDPICLDGDDPGAEQVYRRRLAASFAPRELDTWRRAAVAAAPASAAAHTLVVSRLLTLALAWAQESDVLEGYRTTLWKLVTATGTVSEHPVLAYDPPSSVDRGARRRV